MAQAFQRQGDSTRRVDTILLEMGVLTEDRLARSICVGRRPCRPAVAPLQTTSIRARWQGLPRQLDQEFHVHRGLRRRGVASCVSDTVDLGQLEALATRNGAPIQPVRGSRSYRFR